MFNPTAYRIPEDTVESLILYAWQGAPPGGFLTAFLSNDLMDAGARADDRHQECFVRLVGFVYNEMPIGCHGSHETVAAWVEMGGLAGK